MNLIPKKYPDTYVWFLSDWSARMMSGDAVSVWWSRETYGFNLNDWFRGCVFPDVENGIESEMSEKHPGVSKPSEVIA